MPPKAPRLLRDQRSIPVTSAGVEIAGPNLRRVALIVSAPKPSASGGGGNTSASLTIANVTPAGAGAVLAYTAPPGVYGRLASAYYLNHIGGQPTFLLRYTPSGGVAIQIAAFSGGVGAVQPDAPFGPGDTVDWYATGAGPGSTSDFGLGIELFGSGGGSSGNYVTIDLAGHNALDDGINLYGGSNPLFLHGDHIGQAIRESITGISSSGTQTITVVDIYEDCECVESPYGR